MKRRLWYDDHNKGEQKRMIDCVEIAIETDIQRIRAREMITSPLCIQSENRQQQPKKTTN